MSYNNRSTTRYQAYVIPADARPGDRTRQSTYYLEAPDYWEAKRSLDAMFGDRWESLTEARN